MPILNYSKSGKKEEEAANPSTGFASPSGSLSKKKGVK